MRSSLLATAAVLASLAAAAPADAAKATPANCASSGRSIAGSAQVRVYDSLERGFWACSLRSGRRTYLGLGTDYSSSSGAFDVRPLVTAGRFVGWFRSECPPGGVSGDTCGIHDLIVADVEGGRRLMRHRISRQPRADVSELVVGPTGSAAWVETDERGARTLRRLDPRGKSLVAAGEVGQIALSDRSTLYWTEAGVPRSTTLEPMTPAPAAGRLKDPCGEDGATVDANPWARLYDPLGVAACSIENGRDYFLGESSGSSSGVERAGPAALAGRLVAFYRASCGGEPYSCSPNEVNLLDVRSGRERTVARVPDIYDVEEIVLKRNGSIAYTGAGVRIADRRGERRVGGGGDLALSKRSVVYWTDQDGTAHAAPID